MREGKRARTRLLDVRAMASPLSHPRVGLVVPKHGQTSVERNRLKRRLRELVRLHVLQTVSGTDFLIRARDGAYRASFVDLHAELSDAIERLVRGLQRPR
jgi:ribonuclease P protein component